jgi:hypothetical protein
MTQLIGLVQVLVSKLPPLPAGSPAGVTAVTPLIYTYILNRGKELDALEKICPEIFQKFEINCC